MLSGLTSDYEHCRCRSNSLNLVKEVANLHCSSNSRIILGIFNLADKCCEIMLLTYYVVAAMSHGVYSKDFIIGWTVFALCSPVMAYFAWLTKENGIFPKIVSVGIIAVSVLSSVILFDRLRIYDFIIDGALIYFLFFKKIAR